MTAVPSRKRRGARRHPGEQVEARRNLAEAGEVVLHHEGAVIPERLRLHIVFDEVLEPLGAVDVGPAAFGLGAAE